MRIKLILLVATVLLSGCAHMQIDKNVRVLKRIQPGDPQEMVFEALGKPDIRNQISDRRFVAYYQTRSATSSDEPVTTALCTPVAFEEGRVVAVGDDPSQGWAREEEARQRRLEIARRQREQTQIAEAARRQAARDRLEKIEILERTVKPVPASNPALNLKLYRQLLALDPDNAHYQKKVSFYEGRLASQQKAQQARAAQQAGENRRQAWEAARETRNQKLRQYTGNGIAEMAVHDMGNGSLYVWVKNVSQQIITTHPDYFTLLDMDNNTTACEFSDGLDRVLEPGSLSHGKIDYDPRMVPGELIFENRESGRISKLFQ